MNVVNRILLILLALAVVVAAIAVLLVTLGVLTPEQLAPTVWLRDRLLPFTDLDDRNRAWTIGVSIAALLVGLALLLLELKPPPRQDRLTLVEDALGRVTVRRDSIARLATREATQVPGVLEGRAEVTTRNGRLRIRERLSVDRTAPIPEVTQAVGERVRAAVEHAIGRPVTELRLDTQLEPLEPGRRVR
jgi:hypothetical protein